MQHAVPDPSGLGRSRQVILCDGLVATFRDLRPEDDRLFHAFDERVTDDDRRLRFFVSLHEMPPRMIWDLTHFDRGTAAAVIALDQHGDMLGAARVHATPGWDGEFGLLVRSDVKGRGLGRLLMEEVVRRAVGLGLRSVFGLVMRSNHRMLDLARDLGFTLSWLADEPDLVAARLMLPLRLPPPRSGGAGAKRAGPKPSPKGQCPPASAPREASNRNQVRRSVSSM